MRVGLFVAVFVTMMVLRLSPALSETPGLTYVEETVFTVLEDRVRVDMVATMSNTTEERQSGDTVYFSYFDELVFVVPDGADDLLITSQGARLTFTTEAIDDDFAAVTAALPAQLRSGQERQFVISYLLPEGEIRTNDAFFSNPAFHGFPLWSFSDPGTGSLTLRVPEEAELSDIGQLLRESSRADGYVEWQPKDFERPGDFFTYVNVTREDLLIDESFEVSGQDIVLQSWPGDVEWAEFARSTIETGLPALETSIGVPIPEQGSLEVRESVTPYLFGYAGWYDPAETSIEVGNSLDNDLMLHELSHAWFNQRLFTERWISEGFAEEVAWQTQRALDWDPEEEPETPRATDAGATPLVLWGDPVVELGSEEIRKREVYGYNASWYVIREITAIIGVNGLRDVIVAADSDQTSYPLGSGSERTGAPDDWRRLLDLASLHTDAEGELLLDQLFLDVVVDEQGAQELAERRIVRDRYQRFIDRKLGWNVPVELRVAMTEWRFDAAQNILNEANRVLDLQRRIEDQAELASLMAGEAAREPYERTLPAFDEAREILETQEDAIASVQSVRRLAVQPLTKAEAWGLETPDLTQAVVAAELAYEQNRFADIGRIETQLRDLRQEAAGLGRSRLFWSRIGLGAAILLVLQALAMLWRLRSGPDDEDGELASPTPLPKIEIIPPEAEAA